MYAMHCKKSNRGGDTAEKLVGLSESEPNDVTETLKEFLERKSEGSIQLNRSTEVNETR